MWLACLICSFISLFLPAIISIAISNSGLTRKHNLGLFKSIFFGAVVSVLLIMYPINKSAFAESGFLVLLKVCMLTVLNTVQVFTSGYEFNLIDESMIFCPDRFEALYETWLSVLFAFAPVFTFGFVLSFFNNLTSYFKFIVNSNKEIFVFSELNEKSLVLAADIKSKHENVMIVFTDVFNDNKESSYELIESAKTIGAICFKKDILCIDLKKRLKKKSVSFFVIGYNETENLNQSLKLIERYKECENMHLYIFSTKIESELLLTSVDKGSIKVRRINEVKSLVNRILYEQGEILFNGATELSDGMKKISAVVVGMGSHGTEMVKALAWYGQMDGYRLEINAFDKDPLAEKKFVAIAPELMSPIYNGVDVEGEAQYKITVHPGIDVASITFADEILKITDASYVIVALGNDDVNINTAVNLRMYFERMKIHPKIHAIVYNTQQKQALEGIKNYRGQEYDIEFIGDIESSYTEDVIVDSELEEKALKRHMKWGRENEFWTYEYNYRSSTASAIHMKARIFCGIPGAAKKEEDLTDTERDIIEKLEHRRWNAYMRAEGYIFSGSKDSSSRNDLAKMHHDLVDFSSLTEEEKRKDSRVGTI